MTMDEKSFPSDRRKPDGCHGPDASSRKEGRLLPRLFHKGLRSLRVNGLSLTWEKVRAALGLERTSPAYRTPVSPWERRRQRGHRFPQAVRFSILLPLYNPPPEDLRDSIQSVLDQTYGNWELLLADGSDSSRKDVARICQGFAAQDSRVRFLALDPTPDRVRRVNACLDMASGTYLGLLGQGDLLHPAALYQTMTQICGAGADLIYTDEAAFRTSVRDAFDPLFKPDFAPDTLRSRDYIHCFTAFHRSLLDSHVRAAGSDYDRILRLTEEARLIRHIPQVLYYTRVHGEQPEPEDAKQALSDHLTRRGLRGTVLDSALPGTYRIAYRLEELPLVSILIPNKDHLRELKVCVDSILEKTTYPRWEILILENNSVEEETFRYYRELSDGEKIRVLTWEGPFNYAAINNYGVREGARGSYLLLLNNDVEVITPDWIQEMLMFAQRPDVGAVGAMLYYPDDTVQHAGVILGLTGIAGHVHSRAPRGSAGYMGRLTYAQNLSAVTGACMLVPRRVWDRVGGMDESFAVAYNDVDLCLRIRGAGYQVLWTPYSELYHHESVSRGSDLTSRNRKRFEDETDCFLARWKPEVAADPYFNPNLSRLRSDPTPK